MPPKLFLLLILISSSQGYLSDTVGGFTRLGVWKSTKDSSSTLDYFVSVDSAIQAKAMKSCKKNFDGELLTVSHPSQLRFVITRLIRISVPLNSKFWTAGVKSGSDWYWWTNQRVIDPSDLSFHMTHHHNQKDHDGLGLYVSGSKSGYCTMNAQTYKTRFICQVKDV